MKPVQDERGTQTVYEYLVLLSKLTVLSQGAQFFFFPFPLFRILLLMFYKGPFPNWDLSLLKQYVAKTMDRTCNWRWLAPDAMAPKITKRHIVTSCGVIWKAHCITAHIDVSVAKTRLSGGCVPCHIEQLRMLRKLFELLCHSGLVSLM